MDTTSPWLFEASWEVCHKVGGIHTVIISKLPSVLAEYGDAYLSIGPWLAEPQFEFKEESLAGPWLAVSSQLQSQGVTLHLGRWQVPGEPRAVLLDWQGLVPELTNFKIRFWEQYGLDTLGTDFYDFDTPLLWGIAVGMFTELFLKENSVKVTLQLHEWLSAATLAYLPKGNSQLRTIFTTHATVLGRSLAGRGVAIYDQMQQIDPLVAAKECGVTAKHQLEVLGAGLADAFTTVSDLTAEEATHFLGRHPNVITENGLALHELPLLLENRVTASLVRQELEQIVTDLFASDYQFDASRALWQCTTGRFELHNKGYDLYLRSLAELNEQLKARHSTQSVVALLLIATGNHGIRPEALTGRLLRQTGQPEKILQLFTTGATLSPFLTAADDPIVQLALNLGLRNRQEDRVKVIYLPGYFDGLDGFLNIPLYDLISACDLGVFPSAYEPWGYTPLECIALGVPAITSDLAGFGQAVRQATAGVSVLARRGIEDATASLTALLEAALKQTPRELEMQRIAAYGVSQQFGWGRLYENYRTAYQQAWQR